MLTAIGISTKCLNPDSGSADRVWNLARHEYEGGVPTTQPQLSLKNCTERINICLSVKSTRSSKVRDKAGGKAPRFSEIVESECSGSRCSLSTCGKITAGSI
jgi:hypothetical protein